MKDQHNGKTRFHGNCNAYFLLINLRNVSFYLCNTLGFKSNVWTSTCHFVKPRPFHMNPNVLHKQNETFLRLLINLRNVSFCLCNTLGFMWNGRGLTKWHVLVHTIYTWRVTISNIIAIIIIFHYIRLHTYVYCTSTDTKVSLTSFYLLLSVKASEVRGAW